MVKDEARYYETVGGGGDCKVHITRRCSCSYDEGGGGALVKRAVHRQLLEWTPQPLVEHVGALCTLVKECFYVTKIFPPQVPHL